MSKNYREGGKQYRPWWFVCAGVLRPSQPDEVMSSAVSLPKNYRECGKQYRPWWFVCVGVLRPSQPDGVMSSAVSLPNCPSWIRGRMRMTVKNISSSISTKECCQPRRVIQSDAHPTEPRRPADPDEMPHSLVSDDLDLKDLLRSVCLTT